MIKIEKILGETVTIAANAGSTNGGSVRRLTIEETVSL
jgi:hypothetical protein